MFYNDTKHGWFWYEDPPVSRPKDDIKKSSIRKKVSLQNFTIDELWDMYPDDFQKLLNRLQKKAVQRPTETNIMEYLTMQDIARRKALAYTSASMYVTQKNSALFNGNQVYPTSAPGIITRVQMQQREIAKTLSKASANHALLFFVNPGCRYCQKQQQILAFFTDKYNWQIKTVDISKNHNAAARFNISTTPTLLLIKKGQENYMTVSTGVIALSELERKLYRAIRYLSGNTRGDTFLLYDFEKKTTLDPASILNRGKQPWIKIRSN